MTMGRRIHAQQQRLSGADDDLFRELQQPVSIFRTRIMVFTLSVGSEAHHTLR
jgi:hypothetical protein